MHIRKLLTEELADLDTRIVLLQRRAANATRAGRMVSVGQAAIFTQLLARRNATNIAIIAGRVYMHAKVHQPVRDRELTRN